MNFRSSLLLTALLLAGTVASAQFGPQRDPLAPFNLKTDSWTARWISVPGAGAQRVNCLCACNESAQVTLGRGKQH